MNDNSRNIPTKGYIKKELGMYLDDIEAGRSVDMSELYRFLSELKTYLDDLDVSARDVIDPEESAALQEVFEKIYNPE